MSTSPKNWNLQGPGIGFEIIGGAAVIIWPELRWIAYFAFAIGTVLIILPVAVWAISVINQYCGWQLPFYRKEESSSRPSRKELVGAISAILVAVLVIGYTSYEIRAADKREEIQEEQRAKERDLLANSLAHFNREFAIGQSFLEQVPTNDEEYYEWLRSLGQWEQRMLTNFSDAIVYGVLPKVSLTDFNTVKSSPLGTGYNTHHKKKRGELHARIEIVKRDIRKMTEGLKEL